MRRSSIRLKKAISSATSRQRLAAAHYKLALFHDNNSRESEAVQHYRKALELGIRSLDEADARAWLASSLHKTGEPGDALQELEKSRGSNPSKSLVNFLDGLEKRIQKALDA